MRRKSWTLLSSDLYSLMDLLMDWIIYISDFLRRSFHGDKKEEEEKKEEKTVLSHYRQRSFVTKSGKVGDNCSLLISQNYSGACHRGNLLQRLTYHIHKLWLASKSTPRVWVVCPARDWNVLGCISPNTSVTFPARVDGCVARQILQNNRKLREMARIKAKYAGFSPFLYITLWLVGPSDWWGHVSQALSKAEDFYSILRIIKGNC